MQEKKPLVSVLMPCYNHEKYVATAIESVLNQTYENIELIVADNGCTDGSYDVIKKYEDRITIIRLEKNDLFLCNELLFETSTGEYIAYMTSDDFWMPDKIEKQMYVFEGCPEINLCSTWVYLADEELKINKAESNGFMLSNRSRGEWLNYFVTVGNGIAFPTVVVKRETHIKLKRDAEYGLKQVPDLLYWIYHLFEGNIYVIEEPLAIFRWHMAGDNRNTSAPTIENTIRTSNEKIFMLGYTFENVPDDLFVEAFGHRFVDRNANSRLGILCEKVMLLRQEAEKDSIYQIVYLDFFHKHFPEIADMLAKDYNFTVYDVWNDSGKMGAAYYLNLLGEKLRSESAAYTQGVTDALKTVYKNDEKKVRAALLQFIGDKDKDVLLDIGKSIIGVRKILETCFGQKDVVYVDLLKEILQLADSVQKSRDKWPLFDIDIADSDWDLFIELLMKAAETMIDLDESILPYVDWLSEQFAFCVNIENVLE